MTRTQKAAIARHALQLWFDVLVCMGWFWWFVGFFWSGKMFADGPVRLTTVGTLILLGKFEVFIAASRVGQALFTNFVQLLFGRPCVVTEFEIEVNFNLQISGKYFQARPKHGVQFFKPDTEADFQKATERTKLSWRPPPGKHFTRPISGERAWLFVVGSSVFPVEQTG